MQLYDTVFYISVSFKFGCHWRRGKTEVDRRGGDKGICRILIGVLHKVLYNRERTKHITFDYNFISLILAVAVNDDHYSRNL